MPTSTYPPKQAVRAEVELVVKNVIEAAKTATTVADSV